MPAQAQYLKNLCRKSSLAIFLKDKKYKKLPYLIMSHNHDKNQNKAPHKQEKNIRPEEGGEIIDDMQEAFDEQNSTEKEENDIIDRQLTDIDALNKQLEEAQAQVEKEKKEYLFLMAEFDNPASVRQGMELIYQKLVKFLAANGVKPIESTGKPFDAEYHEAIAMVPVADEAQKGIVIDTPTKGYTINDKVLRHAKVAVGQ